MPFRTVQERGRQRVDCFWQRDGATEVGQQEQQKQKQEQQQQQKQQHTRKDKTRAVGGGG